jgi:hypothetical protein
MDQRPKVTKLFKLVQQSFIEHALFKIKCFSKTIYMWQHLKSDQYGKSHLPYHLGPWAIPKLWVAVSKVANSHDEQSTWMLGLILALQVFNVNVECHNARRKLASFLALCFTQMSLHIN